MYGRVTSALATDLFEICNLTTVRRETAFSVHGEQVACVRPPEWQRETSCQESDPSCLACSSVTY